jgi:hypothetical protein
MQNVLFYVLRRETFVQNVRLRYLTIRCSNVEYKKMYQDLSQGQLYDVHNKIMISEKHWLDLLIYYETIL